MMGVGRIKLARAYRTIGSLLARDFTGAWR